MEPKLLSFIENCALAYSKSCKRVNNIANITQITIPIMLSNFFPSHKDECPQVTKAPEDNKITVLNNGIPKGLGGITPNGGQIPYNSTLGIHAQ